MRWLVEWLLSPVAIDPDPAPMIGGGIYHRVLQRTFEELRGVLTPAQLENARSIALGALREECARRRLAPREHEHAAQVRKLETSVLRYLAFAAESGTVFRPAEFELSFGTRHDDREAVQLAERLRLSGRIDRIDLSPAGDAAIVIDYKGTTGGTAQKRWGQDGDLQAGLYALALPALLPGTRVAGALYQPIGAGDQRPRGYLLDGEDPDRTDVVRTDRLDAERGGRAARRGAADGGRRRRRPARGPDRAEAGRLRLPDALRAPVDLPVHAVSAVVDRTLLEDAAGRPIGPGGAALTREQARVVLERDGPLMVAANAGSGKTTVLVERFVRHVVDDGLDPARDPRDHVHPPRRGPAPRADPRPVHAARLHRARARDGGCVDLDDRRLLPARPALARGRRGARPAAHGARSG